MKFKHISDGYRLRCEDNFEARKSVALLDQYDEDSAEWLYTRALWLYRHDGGSRKATKALKEAFKQNPFVPLYLSGIKEPPRRLPEYMGFGDESEAIHYFVENVEAWLDSPGALEWFADSFKNLIRDLEEEGIMESQDEDAWWLENIVRHQGFVRTSHSHLASL